MLKSIAAPQARGKKAGDVIFGASNAAIEAAARLGKAAVTNATIGAILDEKERLVCLPTVEKVYRSLPMEEIINYAPIAGLPSFLKDAQDCCFGDFRPEGYTAAVSTSGGTGVIHHVIQNYTAPGDDVLTSDWYWGAYSALCDDNGRHLRTYRLFDNKLKFNHADFQANVNQMAEKQENLVIVINTPAHNPTGYSLTEDDWDGVLDFFRALVKKGKHVILLADVAYIDYAGENARKFFLKFSGLPEEILVVVGYSMSKSFTMYGQRLGAMIGISPNQDIIREFADINAYTSRATWSNNSRGAMACLTHIFEDPALRASWKKEQQQYYRLTKERADIFTAEAHAAGLPILPYQAGFFISIPSPDSAAACNEMHKENIFLVPLKAGIRIAVCAVPKAKMHGMAGKLKKAMESIGQI